MNEKEHKDLIQKIYDSLYETACSKEFQQSIDPNLLNEYFVDPRILDKCTPPYKEQVIGLNATISNLPTPLTTNSLTSFEAFLSDHLNTDIPTEKKFLYQKAFEKITHVLTERIHDISIKPYGSYACGFLIEGVSDIDIEFSIPSDVTFGLQYKRVVDFMSVITKLVLKEGYENVDFLRRARTPVIKLTCPETKINIDITHFKASNNKKTEMLIKYCPENSIERNCVLFVRKWARERDLILSNKCMMNPYGWTLLIITFILAYKRQCVDKKEQDKINITNIIYEFFNFIVEFDAESYSCSLFSEGFTLKKEEQFYEKQRNVLCIEDPFDACDNVGRNITSLQLDYIKHQATKTLNIIKEGTNLENVFVLEKEDDI